MQNKILKNTYTGELFGQIHNSQNRIMIGIPMTGLVRAEWMIARYGQAIPCNWSQVDSIQWLSSYSPLNFMVADARNIIATQCVEQDFEWLFFIDHDTIIPADCILRWNDRMLDGTIPVFSGLYFTRSVPSEPLVYRGRGNSYYKDWKIGDEVWVDGIPMGCTMIHGSILKAMYNESEEYECRGMIARKIFNTPVRTWLDPEKKTWFVATGTEDLEWCTRVITGDFFAKAGWPKFAKKKHPFLIDTNVFCRHIDLNGVQFPSAGEEQDFMPEVEDNTLGISVSDGVSNSEAIG